MEMTRSSGILLHPTSLPGPHGIGDLGEAAYHFVDFLYAAKQTLWQVLPLGPTGYGDSPYASFSTFAGNPLLISLNQLVESADLTAAELVDTPPFPTNRVDYSWVIHWKTPLLRQAAHRFLHHADPTRQQAYDTFCQTESFWLDDFALFMTIKAVYDEQAQAAGVDGAMWSNYWPEDIRLRQPEALARWQTTHAEEITLRKIIQFFFFEQWNKLHRYANERGIKIVGDIPIFVAADSVDVWGNPDLFLLNEKGQPTAVAGVPPDYFSETGQLWGNPLYDWETMTQRGFAWWLNRIQATLRVVDVVRIDHFRGFEAYWQVPAEAETAIDGEWVKAPGRKLFETVLAEMGALPLIAEDLGVITPQVEALRDAFNFPGMKILQFAFDSREAGALNAVNAFLPHNYTTPHCVVYTGTHDNDTTVGWYAQRTEAERDLIRRYLARSDHDVAWAFIRLAMSSVANWAIIPLQDVLMLGSEARMNTPSVLGGNWEWRYQAEALTPDIAASLRDTVDLFGRDPQAWVAFAQEKEAAASTASPS